MKKKIFTMLALLCLTATGAWAQATFGVKEITPDMVPSDWNGDNSGVTADDLAKWGFVEITEAEAKTWTGAPQQVEVRLIYSISSGCKSVDWAGGNISGFTYSFTHRVIYNLVCDPQYSSSYDVYITTEPPIEVTPVAEPAANTNQWTFDMPASDVELTPIYAPVAQWATESDVELLPTAAEGIFAGTTDPIIVEGTVAPGQGIVMYAVTSTNQATAPELSAFSATVPTAENIADEGADVLVWYYIKGADAPDGQEATAENTFNDSEICATPLEVSVLSNQFDITFNAANANTIESGKATVTVGGTAATVTEGKLEGVKMGSEVKLKAKEGYKFRKVEVKKKAAAAKTITIGDVELTYADGDTWEAIVSKNSDKIKTIAGGYIVQVAQPAPNQYRYIHVWYTGVKPSDIIDPSKNYQWGTMEVAW